MSPINANLYASFQQKFLQYADKIALTTVSGVEYSYHKLDSESARLAAFLTSRGLQPGDRITVQVQKSPQVLVLYLACLRAGFVFHPLNTAYKQDELDYYLNDAEPAAIICAPKAEMMMKQLAVKAHVPHVYTLTAAGAGSLIDAAAGSPDSFDIVFHEKDDMATLLYSSGTTGAPKGVMLTHANLLENARSLVDCWGFTDKDILFHALPIFHVHGLFVALGCVFLSGASMCWAPRFSVQQAISFLPQCTVMMGVPTYYTRLLAQAEFTEKISENIRLFISGSAPLLAATFHQFEARTGHRILERYGMTETNMSTSNPLSGERKPGTVGLPLPGVELRILDDEQRLLSAGEIGNLQVRGNNVFKGYWKMPGKTSADFSADGFFNTGDKAVIDQDGYVSIVGRSKDMIISGGLNVYPSEIELILNARPEIREAAVIGVPHADLGEAVVAVVVTEGGTQAEVNHIIDQLRDKLAAFKLPKKIIPIDELPRNAMGKVQKNRLRNLYQGILE